MADSTKYFNGHSEAKRRLRAETRRFGWHGADDDVTSHVSARARQTGTRVRRESSALAPAGKWLVWLFPVVLTNAFISAIYVFVTIFATHLHLGLARAHAKVAFISSIEDWEQAIISGHTIKAILAFIISWVPPLVIGDLLDFWDILGPANDMLEWLIEIVRSEFSPSLWDASQEPTQFEELTRDPLDYNDATH